MKTYITALLLLCCVASVHAAWTTPTPLSSINTPGRESAGWLSSDGLKIYYASDYYSGGYFKLYSATRENTASSFANIKAISELNTSGHVCMPWVSQDGQRLYYSQNAGTSRLKMSTWNLTTSSWNAGQTFSEFNALGSVEGMRLSADELTGVFWSLGSPQDMYIATRSSTTSAFTSIRKITEINTAYNDGYGYLSDDGLSLYFHSDRSGQFFIYKSTRASLNDTFGTPETLPFAAGIGCPALFDGGMLLNTNWDLYISTPESATMALLALGAIALRKKVAA